MIHHVYANRSNIGDWLSARGIQSLLGCPVVEHLCDQPYVDDTLVALQKIDADDMVVIGGGGLLMDYFEPFWQGLLRLSSSPRYCIWGVGYCDLKREPSRPPVELIRQVIANSECCFVRDELTRQHLAECELQTPVACPSVAVLTPRDDAIRGVLHVDNYTTAGPPAFEFMNSSGQAFARSSGRPFNRTNNRLESVSDTNLARVLDLYHRSDIVLSSALHGCVIGAALGKKVLAVSGDYKIEAFMHAAGWDEWVLDIADVASVPMKLETIARQVDIGNFLSTTRDANAAIAETILNRAGLSHTFNASGRGTP